MDDSEIFGEVYDRPERPKRSRAPRLPPREPQAVDHTIATVGSLAGPTEFELAGSTPAQVQSQSTDKVEYHICNIKRGKGERGHIVYAQLRDNEEQLIIAATLDYIVARIRDLV